MKLLGMRPRASEGIVDGIPEVDSSALSEHAAVGLYRLDATGNLVQANPRLAQMLGFASVTELLEQRRDFRATLYADSDYARRLTMLLAREGGAEDVEVELLRRGGGRFWASEAVVRVLDDTGRRLGEVGTLADISKRHVTEEAYAHSEEQYRTLVEHSQDGVFVARNGRYLYVNPVYARMLGYEPEEMIGEDTLRFFAPDEQLRIHRLRERRRSGDWERVSYEARLLKKDGETEVYVSVNSGPIRFLGENASTGTVRDVTSEREARRRLAAAENRYREIVEHAVVGIYQSSRDGKLLSANPALVRMLGYESVEEFRSSVTHLRDVYITEGRREALLKKLETEGSVRGEELRMRRRDGHEVWLSETARVVRDGAGGSLYYEGMLEDISNRKATEQALARSELLFRTLIENAHVGVFLVRDGCLSYVNQAFAAMLGYGGGELIGRPVANLAAPESAHCAAEFSRLAASSEGRIERECTLIASDGVRRVIGGISAAVARIEEESVTIVTVRDLTAQKAIEQELRHHASHDPLTGLPNRTLFRERLVAALAKDRRRGAPRHAVLFVDLDASRLVNDSLGHAEGDRLLMEAARRLRRMVGDCGAICRYGSDEFAVLAEGVVNRAEAVALAERIEADFAKPFRLGDHEIYGQTTIGIVLCGLDYDSPEVVLRDADAAMATAKRLEEGNHVFFDGTVRNAAMDRLQLESALRAGLARGEFEQHYQPIYDLTEGRIKSFETLLRWRQPERGLLEPELFLGIAEETGLLLEIGWDGLDAALSACSEWCADGAEIPVAVNLSNQQFRTPQLPDRIASALERSGLPARLLHLEVTEAVFVDNPVRARRMLRRLHALGVELHLDDFGTGYSALSYLSDLPFDALKIDRSFVEQLPHGARARAIVRNIIALARDLGVGVIAEGIERNEQAAALTAMDCTLGQGHLLGPVLDAPGALALVNSSVS